MKNTKFYSNNRFGSNVCHILAFLFRSLQMPLLLLLLFSCSREAINDRTSPEDKPNQHVNIYVDYRVMSAKEQHLTNYLVQELKKKQVNYTLIKVGRDCEEAVLQSLLERCGNFDDNQKGNYIDLQAVSFDYPLVDVHQDTKSIVWSQPWEYELNEMLKGKIPVSEKAFGLDYQNEKQNKP